MGVIRFQKGGMTAVYKGVIVKTSCSSLSEGLELIGENGTTVASFTPNDLKEMVSKSIRDHKVRKFALLVDSKTNKKMMDLFLINPSIITKYWDEILSLNSTGRVELCLRSTKNSRLFLNLYADKINDFVNKEQIINAEGVNRGQKAEDVLFATTRKKKNDLVDGYLLKRTKNGRTYKFSVQLKCSSNRANTNGIVKF